LAENARLTSGVVIAGSSALGGLRGVALIDGLEKLEPAGRTRLRSTRLLHEAARARAHLPLP
jgi:hypothetical protein